MLYIVSFFDENTKKREYDAFDDEAAAKSRVAELLKAGADPMLLPTDNRIYKMVPYNEPIFEEA